MDAAVEVLLVVCVFRCGTRSPFLVFPNTASQWVPSPGLGRLTAPGLEDMRELGRNLAGYYGDFLRADGTFSASTVRARATDHAWTLLSAQAVLRGMFSEKWLVKDSVPQVFPVHVNQDKDDLLLLSPRNCPLYKYNLDNERPRDPAWRRLVNESHALVERLKEIMVNTTGQPQFVSLENWDLMYDPIECALANAAPLPNGITQEDADAIVRVADQIERLSYPAYLGGLLGGNMMQHFLQLMEEAVAAKPKPPQWEKHPFLHLFAGHRETMSALMSVLSHEIERVPRFGDHLELELVREHRSGKVRVRARLNSRDSLLRVCLNASQADGSCELSEFAAEMRAKMAADWGLTCARQDATSRCEGVLQQGGVEGGPPLVIWSPVNGLWYVVSLAAGLLVVGMAVLVFWKWKHHARVDDVPEEVPLQPIRKPRGPKKFTLE